mmetsp:Transcript_18048/g.57736  ORF Transcript_18048/g.57736 Transcript_18048/m.57736 type:complete len:220 (-) Transcript_18048:8-667(-)
MVLRRRRQPAQMHPSPHYRPTRGQDTVCGQRRRMLCSEPRCASEWHDVWRLGCVMHQRQQHSYHSIVVLLQCCTLATGLSPGKKMQHIPPRCNISSNTSTGCANGPRCPAASATAPRASLAAATLVPRAHRLAMGRVPCLALPGGAQPLQHRAPSRRWICLAPALRMAARGLLPRRSQARAAARVRKASRSEVLAAHEVDRWHPTTSRPPPLRRSWPLR